LAEIWAYIGEENIGAADRLVARFTSAFVRLRSFPELGERLVRPRGEFRQFAVGNYVLIYQIVAGEIRILRVVHGARDWGSLI
jgi:toxin ParE1/3/4